MKLWRLYLRGTRAYDLSTIILMSLVLLGTGLFASYIAARRATKLDPVVALREE